MKTNPRYESLLVTVILASGLSLGCSTNVDEAVASSSSQQSELTVGLEMPVGSPCEVNSQLLEEFYVSEPNAEMAADGLSTQDSPEVGDLPEGVGYCFDGDVFLGYAYYTANCSSSATCGDGAACMNGRCRPVCESDGDCAGAASCLQEKTTEGALAGRCMDEDRARCVVCPGCCDLGY